MLPETAARYRRIAAALEQRGVEPKLLDECPGIWTGVGSRKYGHDHDPELRYHCAACPCQNIPSRTVVPSEAECFWRLTLVSGATKLERHQTLDGDTYWVATTLNGYEEDVIWGEEVVGTDPLDALARAVEQALGLEKEVEA